MNNGNEMFHLIGDIESLHRLVNEIDFSGFNQDKQKLIKEEINSFNAIHEQWANNEKINNEIDVSISAIRLTENIKLLYEKNKELIPKEAIDEINDLEEYIEDYLNTNSEKNIKFENGEEEYYKNIDLKYKLLIEKQSKENNLFSKKIDGFKTEINNLKRHTEEKIASVNDFYEKSTKQLTADKRNIDNLLGKVSEGAIAGDFDKSATIEKKSADKLRMASLFCMVVIACVVGYSLYETTTDAFKWETSLFRLIFSVLLSVPAAYLARESAKHRQQQHSHHETSLNLKAIGPYIASLPENEQNLIKSDIAKKMFTPKIQAIQNTDYYPINTQELFLKLFDKMDFKPQKDSKADTDKDKDK